MNRSENSGCKISSNNDKGTPKFNQAITAPIASLPFYHTCSLLAKQTKRNKTNSASMLCFKYNEFEHTLLNRWSFLQVCVY